MSGCASVPAFDDSELRLGDRALVFEFAAIHLVVPD